MSSSSPTSRRHLSLASSRDVLPPAPGDPRRPAGPIGPGPAQPHQPTAAARAAAPVDVLADLGWDVGWAATAADHGRAAGCTGSVPGRIARTDRGRALVATAGGQLRAALLHPDVTTGDWVLLEPAVDPAAGQAGTGQAGTGRAGTGGAGNRADGTVRAVLPRRTALIRGGGRKDAQAHLLAANVDVVLITVALTAAPDPGRLDRLLTVAWNSGARPVVVLTKADLSRTAPSERDEVAELAPGTPVVLTSTVDGRGLTELRGHLAPGRTLALLGVSGAGKSSLVNALAGAEVSTVAPIRADGKGRHTTTARELVVLPGLGVLLDTPGLRGVQLWAADDGLDRTFADVAELTEQCRFTDCGHETEPGCAVTAAVAAGLLSPRRLDSYLRLQRENAWLQRRYDARLRAEQRRRWRGQVQAARQRRLR